MRRPGSNLTELDCVSSYPDSLAPADAGVVVLERPFADLGLSATMVAQALGYADGLVPEPFRVLLDDALREARERVVFTAGCVTVPRGRMDVGEDCFHADGVRFDTGSLIALGLRHAEALGIYVVTAGPGYHEWLEALLSTGDPFRGCLVDALGGEIVERGADVIRDHMEAIHADKAWRASARYGPGYCDWKLMEQHKLFALVPPGFCGVTLGESAIMQPMKSVSGVFAMGPRVKRRAGACAICTLQNCFRRDKRQ